MTMIFNRIGSSSLAGLAVILLLTGCASEELQAPPAPTEGTLTVDASTGWAYVSLAAGQALTVADPTSDPSWDVAFNATRVMVSGGAAGPGGVASHCVCQNAGATDQ